MNAEKVFFTLILVIILISGWVTALFVYDSIQNSRIIHLAVKVDRPSFEAGENVTFKLIDNTPDIKFNATDPNNSPQSITIGMGEINIVKIPDNIDLDTVVEDLSNKNAINRYFHPEFNVATIHYEYFDSNEKSKNMSWDGAITEYRPFNRDFSPTQATSGYYVIVPNFLGATGHRVELDAPQGAIFYYHGLDAKFNITNDPDHSITVRLSLGAPPEAMGVLKVELFTDFQYTKFPIGNISRTTMLERDHYHNETLVLTPGMDTLRTIVYDVRIPDHGERFGDAFSFQAANFDAMLVTSFGNYTFGTSGIWNGGWENNYQY
ncbi:MAG TPA: hypothetical protein VGK23_02785 [Methanomassiliicoccales archaeon]|jgi:hypothetical protein